MPDYRDLETLRIRRQEGEAARSRRPPVRRWPSSPHAVARRERVPLPPLALGREKAPPVSLPGTLIATRLKVSATLSSAELLAVDAPNGKPRVTLRVHLPDRTLTAEIAAKSLRRALRAIRETGADNIALVLQGCLTAGDVIAEAGLSAQPKVPKAAPP